MGSMLPYIAYMDPMGKMMWYDLMWCYDVLLWYGVIWYDTTWRKHDSIWHKPKNACTHVCLLGRLPQSLLSKTPLEACEWLRCRSCAIAYGTIAWCLTCHLRTVLGNDSSMKRHEKLFNTCYHCRLTRHDIIQNRFDYISEGTAKETFLASEAHIPMHHSPSIFGR